MNPERRTIRDYVDVRPHPTVVRLTDLPADGAGWLTESFLVTGEVRNHLHALRHSLAQRTGCGVFLIGPYGSGKSHFLAYLASQLRAGGLLPGAPAAVAVSLVNYSSTNRLEDVVGEALGVAVGPGDRRPAWDAMLARHGGAGMVLLLDEVSEFLRAKSEGLGFSEDVRFLQFLGEWAQDRPFWIVAAMQEGIEHTGEIEYGLYRKIKDRYPLRLLLTPAHVQSLIAESILVKRPGYADAVEALCDGLRAAVPDALPQLEALRAVYPLHPATLELLDEVRDRFSQARGVVDFTVTRLRGDAARGVAPFLDEPFGSFVSPDAIVDHFGDLLAVQPEFLPLAQQLFPWYEKSLASLFDRPALRALAERVLKLLVLVHLSPAREGLSAREAAAWLLLDAARVDPARNLQILERVLATLAERGRYVTAQDGRYRLDLRDDSGAALERLLAREVAALDGQDALVLETAVSLLPAGGFNPFHLPRDAWQARRVAWHFHERRYSVWLGDRPPEPLEGLGLCVRLPWGDATPAPGLFTVVPAPIPATRDLVELAALARLRERPNSPELARRIAQRLDTRAHLIGQAVRAAWQQARLITPDGGAEPAPRLDAASTLESWLESVILWALRRIYPGFERFAPGHGPLPKEAWLRLMRSAATEDLGAPLADEYVRLIREAYLVPMGLMRRKGQEYATPANLDRHELVRLLAPLLEHGPSPRTVHEHLAQPIYGLVPDQVNLLLVFLLLQGEIDILKDRKSYREAFETLPNPLQYDRVVPGHALASESLAALGRLCQGLGIATPAHWSVLTQRRCAAQLAEVGRRQRERLEPLARRLAEADQGAALAVRLQRHCERWRALDAGANPLHGLEQFLYEVGAPAAFLDEVEAYRELPERCLRLLAERQRYTHLLGDAGVRGAGAGGADGLGPAPPLDEPQALERWLRAAAALYESYKAVYRERHEGWRQSLEQHAIWDWTPPALARSRHVDAAALLQEIDARRHQAERARCPGLVDLDYQPRCACGFDGERAPADAAAQAFDASLGALERQLRLFFQQERVKSRLREWQRQGVELRVETLAYLEGSRPLPEIDDIASFDDALDGIDLAAEVEAAPVVALLQQRLWRPDDLLEELRRLFAAAGAQRLRFVSRAGRDLPAPLLAWCAEQSLRAGVPLPADLTRGERAALAAELRPEWVAADAVRRLDTLGFDDAGVDRILGWLIEGQVGLPEAHVSDASPLAAVLELRQARRITSAAELARVSRCLYRAHARLSRIAPARWPALLDGVAAAPVADLPALTEVLAAEPEAQWLLVDGLGLPLLEALEPVLFEGLGDWRGQPARFAVVSEQTSTDACYRALLAADLTRPLEKIDVVDGLIHEAAGERFDELAALAQTKLAGAIRRAAARLDAARPLLVFADHGFRLARDGRRYTHGGPSTLERVVPVWRFTPR